MAYLNINNYCSFEGRIARDIETSTIQAGGKPVTKVRFTVAVDKGLGKEAKARAQESNQPTADFIPFDCIGPKAEFIFRYFQKGAGIRIVASYRAYQYEANGETKYGHSFDVVDAGFTVGGSAQGGGAPQPQGKVSNSQVGDNSQFAAVGDEDLPF